MEDIMLKEIMYGFLPYSLNKYLVNKRCGFYDQNEVLKNSQIVLSPSDINLDEIVQDELDKAVAFLPYCAKPNGEVKCPLTHPIYGRKDSKCLKLDGMNCDVPCSLGKMLDVLQKHGLAEDQILIVDNDSNLLSWLKRKKEDGYKYIMPGVACHYGVGYALNYISKKLGFKGCIVFLEDSNPDDKKNGVCKCISDYMSMEKYDKGKLTKINESSIITIENILAGKNKFLNKMVNPDITHTVQGVEAIDIKEKDKPKLFDS